MILALELFFIGLLVLAGLAIAPFAPEQAALVLLYPAACLSWSPRFDAMAGACLSTLNSR